MALLSQRTTSRHKHSLFLRAGGEEGQNNEKPRALFSLHDLRRSHRSGGRRAVHSQTSQQRNLPQHVQITFSHTRKKDFTENLPSPSILFFSSSSHVKHTSHITNSTLRRIRLCTHTRSHAAPRMSRHGYTAESIDKDRTT